MQCSLQVFRRWGGGDLSNSNYVQQNIRQRIALPWTKKRKGCRDIPHSKDSVPSNWDTRSSYTQDYLDLHNLRNHQNSNNNKQNPLFVPATQSLSLAYNFSNSSTSQQNIDGATCKLWEKNSLQQHHTNYVFLKKRIGERILSLQKYHCLHKPVPSLIKSVTPVIWISTVSLAHLQITPK